MVLDTLLLKYFAKLYSTLQHLQSTKNVNCGMTEELYIWLATDMVDINKLTNHKYIMDNIEIDILGGYSELRTFMHANFNEQDLIGKIVLLI